jgi:hypothetical protein
MALKASGDQKLTGEEPYMVFAPTDRDKGDLGYTNAQHAFERRQIPC